MSNRKSERELIELLENQGVSRALSEEVSAYNPSWQFTVLYTLCSLSIFLGVMIFGFIFGSLLFLDDKIASSRAVQAQAILFRGPFSLSTIIFLFAWIFCSGAIILAPMRALNTKLKSASFILFLTWGGIDGPFARGRLRHSLKDHPNPASVDELINNWNTRYIKAISKVALPILLVVLAAYQLERNSWAYVTWQGYTENPFNPFKKTTTIPWDELSSVELGCNHTDDSDFIIYEIKAQSISARLSSFKTPDNRDELDALLEVDNFIRNHTGVKFERWKWMSRNPMHPACLRHFQSTMSEEDFSRLLFLLRVGEFPND